MQVFVAVSEQGGLSAAARKLGLSPAAVTRAVVALEEQLGVALLLRTTRNVRLTDAGQQYLEDTRAILASIIEANDKASGINAEPGGQLMLTAPVLFGRHFVLPCVLDYMQRYPGVEVNAQFLDRVVNLVEDGFDVAVRIGHLPDSTLRAVKVGRIRRVLCASPSYLDAHGTPAHPTELLRHTIAASSATTPRVEWQFRDAGGTLSVLLKPRLLVSTNDGALDAAIAGLGVTRLMSYQSAQAIDKGQLKVLLEEFEEEPWPVHLVHREGRHRSSKVRAFIDIASERMRTHPLLRN